MNSSVNALKFPSASTAAASDSASQAGRLSRIGAAVWRALESIGQSRARRELLLLADRWAVGQPELAAQLRASCQSLAQPSSADHA